MPISTSCAPTRHAHGRAATPGPSCDAASRPTTPPAPHPSTPPPTTPARPAPPTPPAAAPSSAGTANAAGSAALPDARTITPPANVVCGMATVAERVADWAAGAEPMPAELDLADDALVDTLSVIVAAGRAGLHVGAPVLGAAGAASALAHVLDFDDLHLPSTAHISAVCLPVALACGGDARAFLVGSGVMARLGTALGWAHYRAGWHATCTAGAPAGAATAAVARGLGARGSSTAT